MPCTKPYYSPQCHTWNHTIPYHAMFHAMHKAIPSHSPAQPQISNHDPPCRNFTRTEASSETSYWRELRPENNQCNVLSSMKCNGRYKKKTFMMEEPWWWAIPCTLVYHAHVRVHLLVHNGHLAQLRFDQTLSHRHTFVCSQLTVYDPPQVAFPVVQLVFFYGWVIYLNSAF